MYCFAISDVDDQRGPGRQFTHFITNSNDIVIRSLNATIISYIGVRVFLVFDITECSGLWEVCGMKNYQNIFGFGPPPPPPHTHVCRSHVFGLILVFSGTSAINQMWAKA